MPLAAPAAQPSTAELLSLAVDQFRNGRIAEALATVELGLALAPDHAGLLNNQGIFAFRLGKTDAAEAAYRKALRIQPGYAEAWNNLGNLLSRSTRKAEAEDAYRRAILGKPGYLNAARNLVQLLIERQSHDECWPVVQGVENINGTSPDTLALRAAIHLAAGSAAAAADAGAAAVAMNPAHVDALCNLGLALFRLDRLAEAETMFDRALAIQPGNLAALQNRADLLLRCGRPDDAEHAYALALQAGVSPAPMHVGLGNFRWQQRRLGEAEAHFREAIRHDPAYPLAWNNLGGVMRDLRRPAESEAALRRELARDPDCREARWNLALLLLEQGRYAEGWQDYEVRLGDIADIEGGNTQLTKNGAAGPVHRLPQFWRDGSIAGKRLLVWTEGGCGDEIQFVRYLPLLKDRGAQHVGLVCRRELKSLLERQGLADRVMAEDDWHDGMTGDFDLWCPLLSLPMRFGTTLGSIPDRMPYLKADIERLRRWRERLPTTRPRIGLVWRGSRDHMNDAARSLPRLTSLAALWTVPGVGYVSLQKGGGEEEAQHPPDDQPLVHLGSDFEDFADTAAAVSLLDLVITVDTSCAHLAAACGTPTWILLPATGTDWRWLTGRTDSPWYPGIVRLFRQLPDQPWEKVIEEVRSALLDFARKPAP